MRRETVLLVAAFVLAAGVGLSLCYLVWGWPINWYVADVAKLGPGPENDLIRYGRDLIVETPRHIGKTASEPALRFAGNDLACQSYHLNAGLQPFAAPFVSTFATFPMMVDDQVLTLTERINGCMLRSMNGKKLPSDSREMNALIAYLKFVGQGTPEGVRVAGMGSCPCRRRNRAQTTRGRRLCTHNSARAVTRRTGRARAVQGAGEATRSRRCGPTRLVERGSGNEQARLCRGLYPRQHAFRRQLRGARALGAAGLGCRGLYDLKAATPCAARCRFGFTLITASD